MKRIKHFLLHEYIQKALEHAEYSKDENGVIIARVPNVSGFYSQGETFEEARGNLEDVIEGNILLALQLGFDIPEIEGILIKEEDVPYNPTQT